MKLVVGRRHPPKASKHARIAAHVVVPVRAHRRRAGLHPGLGVAQEIPLLFIPLYAATFASEWSLIRSRSPYPSDVMAGGAIAVAVALVARRVWPSQRSLARQEEEEEEAAAKTGHGVGSAGWG